VLKVSKFYEFVHDKPIVGMTVQSPVDMQLQGQETRIVESWPLIQAYGLDSKFNFKIKVVTLYSCWQWFLHYETQVG